jgi:hypothetical protein
MQDADRPLRRMEVAARIKELRRLQAQQDPCPPGADPAGLAPEPEEVDPASAGDERLTGPGPGQPLTAAERIARMLLGGDGA